MIVRFRTQQLTGMVYLPLQFLHQPLEILDRLERAQVSITGGEIRYRVSSSAVAAASIRVLLVIDKEGTGTALSEYFDTAGVFGTPLLHSRFSTETGVQISRLFTTSYMNLIIKQAIFSNMRRLKSQRCRYSSTMLVPQFVRTL